MIGQRQFDRRLLALDAGMERTAPDGQILHNAKKPVRPGQLELAGDVTATDVHGQFVGANRRGHRDLDQHVAAADEVGARRDRLDLKAVLRSLRVGEGSEREE